MHDKCLTVTKVRLNLIDNGGENMVSFDLMIAIKSHTPPPPPQNQSALGVGGDPQYSLDCRQKKIISVIYDRLQHAVSSSSGSVTYTYRIPFVAQ